MKKKTARMIATMTMAMTLATSPGEVRAQLLSTPNQVIDCGQVLFRKPVTVHFEITNQGKGAVTIKEVETSCGCINVSYPKGMITENKPFVVTATYDAKQMGHFEKYFDINHLSEVFSKSPVCDIHGDLTIENIICDEDSYYLIDPNTGNILECPYLDLGKLFQSLHGGYEFLMRIREVSVYENRINFTFMRSSAYDELYQRLRQYIIDTYDDQVLRQVYYHELIHWLRLMPYKLNHLGDRSLIFYAGMLMVLNSIFPLEKEK